MPTARSRKTVVGTVASLLVLINTVGLARLDHEADFSAALMEVIVRGRSKGETVLIYELCFTGRVLLILIAELYSYWLLHPIV